jgi:dihydrofolate reductase
MLTAMSRIVLDMSVSVDGFVAGPDDGPGAGLGIGGEQLHAWLGPGGAGPRSYRPTDETGALVFDEMLATGAVITGRRTFEFAGGWDGDHHDAVPVLVLTRNPPDAPAPGHARYVTDVASAVEQAKAAAGGRDVMVHGAVTAQECLKAGLLDELELHLVPVLLGQGRLLFDGLPPGYVELELLRALDGPGVQHLRYRVRREA